MINEYCFTIETSPNYYNRLLEITKEETIGRIWVLQVLIRAMVMTFGIFIFVKYAGHEFSLITTFYIWVVMSIYYIYTMYKYSKDVEEEYSIVNLSTKPKKIIVNMSENNILLNEDNKEVAMTWDDINGFDEKKDALLIGYLDRQIMMIDTSHLEPEKYKALLDLIKSKLAKDNKSDTSSSFFPVVLAFITAILGIIFLYIFGYITYNLIIDTPSLVGIIVMGIIGLITLTIPLALLYISRREWRSWKEQRLSNKNEETQ